MSKLLKIGNAKIGEHIKEFFFDGCHKIYLIEDEADKKLFLTEKNYLENDIFSVDELEETFNESCSLRFISTCKLKSIVPQFKNKIKFTYDDHIRYSNTNLFMN